jgi:hypothetical protein
MKKHTLAQDAIEAAVEAIERNGYKLVIPIQFEVTQVPAAKKPSQSVGSPPLVSSSLGNPPGVKVKLRPMKITPHQGENPRQK